MIDLRSDYCAPPTEEMWTAMRSGGERSVAELEARGAELLGKEAALLCPTCTAANLVAVLALSEPGQRAAIDERAHIVVNGTPVVSDGEHTGARPGRHLARQ